MSMFTTKKQESSDLISYDKIYNNAKHYILNSNPSYNATLSMMDLNLGLMYLTLQTHRNKIEEEYKAASEYLSEGTVFHDTIKSIHTICDNYYFVTAASYISSRIIDNLGAKFIEFSTLSLVAYCGVRYGLSKLDSYTKTRYQSYLIEKAEQRKNDYIHLMHEEADKALSPELLDSLYVSCNKLQALSLIESKTNNIEKLSFSDQINQLRGDVMTLITGGTENDVKIITGICEVETLPIE